MSPTTAEAFVIAWAGGPLVRLPVEVGVPAGVGGATVSFLRAAGLPEGIVYGESAGPAHLSFLRLARGLEPVSRVLPAGTPMSPAWRDHVVIGDEWFEGGASPLWCVHGPSGRVDVIDPESDGDAPRVANTSVAHLAQTLLGFRIWAEGGRGGGIGGLAALLRDADPRVYRGGRWADLIEALGASASPGTFELGVAGHSRRHS